MKEILCIGDWGDSNRDLNIQDYIQKNKTDEIYLLGDNFYPSGVESLEDNQWELKLKSLFPTKVKKYACLGNHDYLGNVFSQIEKTFQSNNYNWNLPYFFYDIIDKEYSVHTFFLDTQLFSPQMTTNLLISCDIDNEKQQKYFGLVYHLQKKQLEWFEEKLKNSSSKWKIVCGHYPIFSNGPHIISKELQEKIKPLLKKYKVDFYCGGHEHNNQIIFKENTFFIISGGIFSTNSYKIERISEPTIFSSESQGFFSFQIEKNKIEIFFHNIRKRKKELCSLKIKK